MKNNKVVVFGGSGFLGSHVADTLTNSGYDVTIFDRIKSPYINKNQKMIIGDISNQKKVRNVIKGASILGFQLTPDTIEYATVEGLLKMDEIFRWATMIIEFYFGAQLAKGK